MRKIPMRMCVVTREKLPKNELIRLVVANDEVIIDDTGKINGHGCYIKLEESVIEQAQKSHILDKVLMKKIDDSIYEELRKKLK